jgi:hypothetical protein
LYIQPLVTNEVGTHHENDKVSSTEQGTTCESVSWFEDRQDQRQRERVIIKLLGDGVQWPLRKTLKLVAAH